MGDDFVMYFESTYADQTCLSVNYLSHPHIVVLGDTIPAGAVNESGSERVVRGR